ncbi:PPOX class F420-dependent oxidoreductase [Pedococcus sp. NPDC057267]|uniref:PPOX class F420-dependent oxidoreductase n=1 Tax=Pedococcus sp. NPDC057267 TaxID=3346077 RepID=UPI00362C7DD7
MPTDTTLDHLADEKFVSLTTFRKNGVGVPTPVWIGRDGDALVVTTPVGSGKVKRLRRNRTVELRPCNRRGIVEDDAPTVRAVAQIVEGDAAMRRLDEVLKPKYSFEYRAVMTIERLLRRESPQRVMLRISPVD